MRSWARDIVDEERRSRMPRRGDDAGMVGTSRHRPRAACAAWAVACAAGALGTTSALAASPGPTALPLEFSAPPSCIDAATFRRVLGRFPSGVTIVTVRDGDGVDHGMTVSAFASLSLSPPLVLVCIGDDATIAAAVSAAGSFAVSVLSEGQEALARLFADTGAERFAGTAVSRGTTGLALIDGAVAHLECAIVARHRGGDHTIVVGEVLAARAAEGGRPLIYQLGEYRRLR